MAPGGWSAREVRVGYGVGSWKDIKKEWGIALLNAEISLGDGRRGCAFTRKVKWEEVLCDSFLSLFALADNKEVFIAGVWDSSRDEGGWIPCFSNRLMIGS